MSRQRRGEQTREVIIRATLEVIARDGVRGVSHRAVAREAGVQLSLTTYYFKDLNELIATAFEDAMAQGLTELDQNWARLFTHLDRIPARELRKAATRQRLRRYLVARICSYVHDKMVTYKLGLAVEHQFFFETLVEPGLIELSRRHRERLYRPMVTMCRRLGSTAPEVDADLLLGTIMRLEYESLLVPAQEVDVRPLRRAVDRVLGWILRLPA